jgi:hypothetical protein
MHNRIRASLAALVMLGVTASAQPLIICDFNGVEPSLNTPWTNTSYLDSNVTFSGWQRGAGAKGTSGINDAFAFYATAAAQDSTLAEAIADNEYISFTVQPAAGTLNLNGVQINFSIQRIDWFAPRSYSLFTSLGGFTEGDELFTTTSLYYGDYTLYNHSFIMPLTGYDNIMGPVEFRIYAYETQYSNHDAKMTAFSIAYPGPTVSLTVNSGPGGSATSDPEGVVFEEGTVVSLLAEPDPGYRFAGWSGDITGRGNPRVVTLDADINVTANFMQTPPPSMQVAMNVSGTQDWSTEWDFVDAFKMSRTWLTNEVGSYGWETHMQDEMPVDASGWPLYLPFTASDGNDHYAHTIVPAFVSGDYTLIVEGTGHIGLRSPPYSNYYPTGGTTNYTLPVSSPGSIFISILESSVSDPIRNIRIVMPGFESTYDTQPFHPLFLDRLEPFTSIRFMDWQKTNNCPLVTWADRTTADTYTQTREEGVALEHQIQLCNTLGKDIWVCIPHQADDNFVTQAARLLRDTVDPNLKIYVEYSNETWNGIFQQTHWVGATGLALGLDTDSWPAGQKYVALRSIQIWEIFEDEFTDDSRLVKVMATQGANIAVTNLRFSALNDPSINPNYTMPDSLGIAPYFGILYGPDDIPPAVPAYPTVDQIVTTLSKDEIAQVKGYVIQQKAVAEAQGCTLDCYEGGQHFVGVAGAENDDTLTSVLNNANRDPRMHTRFMEYLCMLNAEGVNTYHHWIYVGAYSKWGSWGVLEYQDQPIDDAHKYRALIDYIDFGFLGDLNDDCICNWLDLGVFSDQWLTTGTCPDPDCADLDANSKVDFKDLALIGMDYAP